MKKEEKLEQKIGGMIFKTLIWMSLFLAFTFFTGYQAIEAQTTIRLVENENYGITYSDREIYVLHKVELKDTELIIYRESESNLRGAYNMSRGTILSICMWKREVKLWF